MGFYSMPRYFEKMPQVGKPLKKANPENEEQLKKIEAEIHELIKAAQSAGRSDESLNASVAAGIIISEVFRKNH